jgi:hypothetical protein
MLGSLSMPIKDTIDNIQMLGMTVFEGASMDTPIEGQKLKDALETILEDKGISPNTMLRDVHVSSGCKRLVCVP